ncbi:MAG: NUDIX domain-containing protein [Clostridia bacterium]|nr:NUDIX domain-containing protein [Clostridia bacterium]
MKKEKSCGAVVWKKENGKILFLIEHMALGHISLPKGHVEGNETEEETALREIREETNLEVRLDTGFRHVVTYSPRSGILKDVVFFIAEAVSDRLINQECEVSALEWLPFEQALKILTYTTDRDILSLAAEYLKEAEK